MSRFARIVYPGGIYHVISRFHNREYLLSGKDERAYYLGLLGQGIAKSDSLLLAWCLMSSHIHLVFKVGKEPLDRLMKGIHSGFAGWLNRQKGRTGAVFADRYKSILVEEELYLLELIRYVHNNPVRARVSKLAKQSHWSSHRFYLGIQESPEWLSSGYVLSMFAKYPKIAREKFSKFVNEGRTEKRRKDFSGEQSGSVVRKFRQRMGDGWQIGGPIVGSEQFQAKVLDDILAVDPQSKTLVGALQNSHAERGPTLDELIALTTAVMGLEPWEFEQQPRRRDCAAARQLIVWIWVQHCGGKQIDVSRKLNTSTAAVSKWYGRAIRRTVEQESIRAEILSKLPSMVAGELP